MNYYDLLEQIALEAGFQAGKRTSKFEPRWHLMNITYCEIINKPLNGTIGISSEGLMWCNKFKNRTRHNYYEEEDFNLFLEKLRNVREKHADIHQ